SLCIDHSSPSTPRSVSVVEVVVNVSSSDIILRVLEVHSVVVSWTVDLPCHVDGFHTTFDQPSFWPSFLRSYQRVVDPGSSRSAGPGGGLGAARGVLGGAPDDGDADADDAGAGVAATGVPADEGAGLSSPHATVAASNAAARVKDNHRHP